MENDNLNKLLKLSKPTSESTLEQLNWLSENESWLKDASIIAIRILSELDRRKMSQKQLAELLSTSQQYVSKLVKGQQNLTLSTIRNLEEKLSISLISISPRHSVKITGRKRETSYVYKEEIALQTYSIEAKQKKDIIENIEEVIHHLEVNG